MEVVKKIKEKLVAVMESIFVKILSLCNFNSGEEGRDILVIRLDEIGDMVLMTGFLRELRRNNPAVGITLVVKPEIYNLMELCPYVNNVLVYPRPKGRLLVVRKYISAWNFAHKNLRARKYRAVIVPRWDSDYFYGAGIIAFFSGASERIGYSSKVNIIKRQSDKVYDCLYTKLLEDCQFRHEAERNYRVLEAMGMEVKDKQLECWTNTDDDCYADTIIERDDGINIALFLSTSCESKNLDVRIVEGVFAILEKRHLFRAYLLGDIQTSAKLVSAFMKQYPKSINLVGLTTLRQTMAILKKSDLYLGGDTGPMHMAVAAGCRGVAWFSASIKWEYTGLNTPERFGPYSDKFVSLVPNKPLPGCENGCIKNFAHCINEIKVDQIVDAVEKQIMIILNEKKRRFCD